MKHQILEGCNFGDVIMDLLCSNSPDNSRRAGQGSVELQEVMKGHCHLTPFILLVL